jgi:hypothetical protein
VGRAEAAGRDDQVGDARQLAQPAGDVLDVVPHDQGAADAHAAQLEVGGQERRVAVGDHPAQQLDAGEQDGRAGSGHAAVMPVAEILMAWAEPM